MLNAGTVGRESTRVCSPPSRRVAPLRPRLRGAEGLGGGSAHPRANSCPTVADDGLRPPASRHLRPRHRYDLFEAGRVTFSNEATRDAKVVDAEQRHQSRVPPAARATGAGASRAPMRRRGHTAHLPPRQRPPETRARGRHRGGDRSIPPSRPPSPTRRPGTKNRARCARLPLPRERGKGQPRGADSRDSRTSVSPGARQGPPEHQARRQSTDAGM